MSVKILLLPGQKYWDNRALCSTGACSLEHARACSLACVAVSIFLARVAKCMSGLIHNIRRSASPIKQPFPCRKHQHWSRTNTVISTKNFFQTSHKGYLQIKPSSFQDQLQLIFTRLATMHAYTLQTQLAMLTNCGKTGMQRWQMCWISTPLSDNATTVVDGTGCAHGAHPHYAT